MATIEDREPMEALYALRGQIDGERRRVDMPAEAIANLRQAAAYVDQALAVVLRDHYGLDRVPRALRKAFPCPPTLPATPIELPST